jgi:hypothetical protein
MRRRPFRSRRGLIGEQPGVDRAAFLQSKQATYRGQDAINRRQFAAALQLLGNGDAASEPLRDVATLAALNQPAPQSGVRAALAAADAAQLSRLLLEAQRSWARSVAYLSVGDIAGARRALDDGQVAVDQLQRAVPADSVAALKARVQRQYGRLAARDGKLVDAVHAFDCAIATLQKLPVADGRPCPLDLPRRERQGAGDHRLDAASNGGPMVAETELERAALLSRMAGVDRAKVLADFADATDTMIASGRRAMSCPRRWRPISICSPMPTRPRPRSRTRTASSARSRRRASPMSRGKWRSCSGWWPPTALRQPRSATAPNWNVRWCGCATRSPPRLLRGSKRWRRTGSLRRRSWPPSMRRLRVTRASG